MRDADLAQRLLDTLEMWEDGVTLMRENLRRRSPLASDEEIERAVAAWLAGPPIDEPGFRVGRWPRAH